MRNISPPSTVKYGKAIKNHAKHLVSVSAAVEKRMVDF